MAQQVRVIDTLPPEARTLIERGMEILGQIDEDPGSEPLYTKYNADLSAIAAVAFFYLATHGPVQSDDASAANMIKTTVATAFCLGYYRGVTDRGGDA